jgi:hypothetical protein
MSEHRILRLKPALRLERRGEHGQNKKTNAIIAPNRFFAQQARIGFSVHTAVNRAILLNTSEEVGDVDHLNEDAANRACSRGPFRSAFGRPASVLFLPLVTSELRSDGRECVLKEKARFIAGLLALYCDAVIIVH